MLHLRTAEPSLIKALIQLGPPHHETLWHSGTCLTDTWVVSQIHTPLWHQQQVLLSSLDDGIGEHADGSKLM